MKFLKFLKFSLGEMQANCYFLLQGNHCIIVDPADSADFILEEVSRRNLTVDAVIATHGHFDHIMAAGELQLALGIPFTIHPADRFLVARLEQTAQHFLGHTPFVIKPTEFSDLKAGENTIGDFTFEVIETPGHTPGSVSLYFPDDQMIFTGDTLFMEAVGRYDFSYSDKEKLKQSVESLLRLPDENVIQPGHGEETTVQMEKMNSPYFFNVSNAGF